MLILTIHIPISPLILICIFFSSIKSISTTISNVSFAIPLYFNRNTKNFGILLFHFFVADGVQGRHLHQQIFASLPDEKHKTKKRSMQIWSLQVSHNLLPLFLQTKFIIMNIFAVWNHSLLRLTSLIKSEVYLSAPQSIN